MATLFIFRRDFRLYDNNGVRYAISLGETVYPIFICTPEQLTNNKYFSQLAVNFMFSALNDLNSELKKHRSALSVYRGKNISVIEQICTRTKIANVVFNMDYTPYARKRDASILKWCEQNDVKCHMVEDYLLAPIGEFCKSDGQPYQIFTPFKNNLLKYKKVIAKPVAFAIKHLSHLKSNSVLPDKDIFATRKYALKLLKRSYSKYDEQRDFPAIEGTSGLSAHIKFGLISVREVFSEWLKYKSILSQLIWREFYYYLAYYRPDVFSGSNFNGKRVSWKHNSSNFKKWSQGRTGIPIVDAGMRELNSTGKMHNRLRLITANYLTRHLKEDWRLGERYFATHLIDYDPSVNNGNWQWVAGTGANTKPIEQQIFNIELQSRKYDKDCIYIKRWLPELKNVAPKDIHKKI